LRTGQVDPTVDWSYLCSVIPCWSRESGIASTYTSVVCVILQVLQFKFLVSCTEPYSPKATVFQQSWFLLNQSRNFKALHGVSSKFYFQPLCSINQRRAYCTSKWVYNSYYLSLPPANLTPLCSPAKMDLCTYDSSTSVLNSTQKSPNLCFLSLHWSFTEAFFLKTAIPWVFGAGLTNQHSTLPAWPWFPSFFLPLWNRPSQWFGDWWLVRYRIDLFPRWCEKYSLYFNQSILGESMVFLLLF